MSEAKPIGRCRVCGWLTYKRTQDGCTPENCSERPQPATGDDERRHEEERFHIVQDAFIVFVALLVLGGMAVGFLLGLVAGSLL